MYDVLYTREQDNSNNRGKKMKTKIVYKGKTYTIDDVPAYIHKKMPKHPDKLTAWINILINKNEWGSNNKEKISVAKKKAYRKNPEKGRARTKEWSRRNPEKKKQMDAEYRMNNKEIIAEYMHNYWIENKSQLKSYGKGYRENPNNKGRITELRNKNNRKYSKNNWYVTRHKIQSQLSTLCGRNGKYNGARYKDIDLNACVDSLINDASSKGYGSIQEIKKTHHIDHIIPVSYYSIDEFVKAYNPLNLRWLPMAENCSRGNKLREEDIKIISKLPLEIYPRNCKALENIK